MRRFDEVLARTDPFDLAQAVERYVQTLDVDRIRVDVKDALARMSVSYRDEFAPVLQLHGEQALRSAFTRVLQRNLRAIPLFGTPFCEALLERVPADRTVGIGEETKHRRGRAAIIAGGALALVFAGALGEHLLNGGRAQEPAAPILSYATPLPLTRSAPVRPDHHILPQRQPVTPPRAPVAVFAGAVAAPIASTMPSAAPQTLQRPQPRAPRPAPAQGAATIVVPQSTASAQPTAEPSALDVSDMPQVYTDATPLPAPSTAPAVAPRIVRLVTPSPKPRKSWFKRALNHIIDRVDPFKPYR